MECMFDHIIKLFVSAIKMEWLMVFPELLLFCNSLSFNYIYFEYFLTHRCTPLANMEHWLHIIHLISESSIWEIIFSCVPLSRIFISLSDCIC